MIGIVVHDLLKNAPAVTNEVADKIFPIIVPQNTQFPAITYEMLGNEPLKVLGNQKIADTVSVQINVFAYSYAKVSSIAQAVKGVLDFKNNFTNNGIHVCNIQPENEMDGAFDSELNLYHRVLKYEISINQPHNL